MIQSWFLTTIQKLNNAISKAHYENKLEYLKDKKLVFIFDECHRSQFGATHDRIISYFHQSQLFGFTGTPIFADNANKNELGKRTTKDLFGQCLHKYVITDAIRDENVLRFGIEYVGRYKQKGNTEIDIEVEDIDRAEVLNDQKRLEKIADYIIAYHGQKTFNKEYSALFATTSIDTLIKYYEIFRKKKEAGEHDLRIATIFTFGTNEDDPAAQDYLPDEEWAMAAEPEAYYKASHTRDKLEEFIGDYNRQYGTSYSTKDSQQFENYFKDISKRLKEREKETFNDEKDRLDLVIVVNMLLTGFDAKKVNTLYVDKNLKYHGLIQAYSRTNRTLGEQKSQGNILCFRNLKEKTDEAITLFSNKDAIEEIILPPYEKIAEKFADALKNLLMIVPTWQSVDTLVSEEDELAFVQAFRALLRIKNVLESYTDLVGTTSASTSRPLKTIRANTSTSTTRSDRTPPRRKLLSSTTSTLSSSSSTATSSTSPTSSSSSPNSSRKNPPKPTNEKSHHGPTRRRGPASQQARAHQNLSKRTSPTSLMPTTSRMSLSATGRIRRS